MPEIVFFLGASASVQFQWIFKKEHRNKNSVAWHRHFPSTPPSRKIWYSVNCDSFLSFVMKWFTEIWDFEVNGSANDVSAGLLISSFNSKTLSSRPNGMKLTCLVCVQETQCFGYLQKYMNSGFCFPIGWLCGTYPRGYGSQFAPLSKYIQFNRVKTIPIFCVLVSQEDR